jgi:hypothetical protein
LGGGVGGGGFEEVRAKVHEKSFTFFQAVGKLLVLINAHATVIEAL